MTLQQQIAPAGRDPIADLVAREQDGVLAVIAGVEGPSYRPIGAMMAVFDARDRTGTLSSGCIESDIALHAAKAREDGAPVILRYGRGSPFADIQLPCGGGLDILLLPAPDRAVLSALLARHEARRACTLVIDMATGAMALAETGETGRAGDTLHVRFEPAIRFLVFGKGPEASTFAALVQSAGYPNLLLSPDEETLEAGRAAGCATQHLVRQAFPVELAADHRTAVTLFFHDHEWEPPILMGALATSSFYIGAQGSRKARDARLLQMEAEGASADALARLRGPIGLIPSARDARTLAVSVLAEVLAVAAGQAG